MHVKTKSFIPLVTIIIFLISLLSLIKNANSYLIPRDHRPSCTKIDADLKVNSTTINYDDVKDCYESFPYNHSLAVSV